MGFIFVKTFPKSMFGLCLFCLLFSACDNSSNGDPILFTDGGINDGTLDTSTTIHDDNNVDTDTGDTGDVIDTGDTGNDTDTGDTGNEIDTGDTGDDIGTDDINLDGGIDEDTYESENPYFRNWDKKRGPDGGSDEEEEDEEEEDDDSDGEDEDPERIIEEADIVKVIDNTLYALSRYRGVVIIDISNADNLRIIGRFQASGIPFEMYVRDNVVMPLYASFWGYKFNPETFEYEQQQSSRILALDVTTPSQITEIASFSMPGAISDSRIVGDVMYTVSYQNGYCWGCDTDPKTVITSLNIADLEDIQMVNQLEYADENSSWGWRRSIAVNTDRIYVSGLNYGGNWEDSNSTIQVVDISDPTGKISLGAEVDVAGRIESRWQMNEYKGVLRVISQPGSPWGSGIQPVVETFTVNGPNDVTPLGSMEMVLPRPENLMSVRFDGKRAYAVTFERTDPLFVIDLSNPEQPVQQGELEIPGWLYHMEPRGDRMIAIGFDEGWGLAVSLFDVADPHNPQMLDRVNFGAEYGWMPEDQDRIHKAFRILDDEGLILMPFSGWGRDDDFGYYSRFYSGIQLIDFTLDDLTLRGVAPHNGRARRAFLHDGNLFAMSDERVEAFDITNRDQPELLSGVKMSRTVYRTAASQTHIAQLVGDWWTNEARLDIFPIDDPDAIKATGSLDLSVLKPENESQYWYWSHDFDYYNIRLFSHGSHFYMVWPEYVEWNHVTRVAAIDASDPTEPRLVDQLQFPFYFYPEDWDSYYWGEAMVGKRYLQAADALLLQEDYYPDDSQNKRVWVINLKNPSDLTAVPVQTQALRDDRLQLIHSQNIVAYSRWKQIGQSINRVRFYLDRLDISNPAQPKWLPSVNIPGTAVSYNQSTGRLITLDYQKNVTKVAGSSECYAISDHNYTHFNHQTGACTHLAYSLVNLQIQNNTAHVVSKMHLHNIHPGRVEAGDNALFVGTPYNWYWWQVQQTDPRPVMYGVSIDNAGDFQSKAKWIMPTVNSRLREVKNQVALLTGDYPPTAHVCKLNKSGTPTREDLFLNGYPYETHLTDDYIISANGVFGVQALMWQKNKPNQGGKINTHQGGKIEQSADMFIDPILNPEQEIGPFN